MSTGKALSCPPYRFPAPPVNDKPSDRVRPESGAGIAHIRLVAFFQMAGTSCKRATPLGVLMGMVDGAESREIGVVEGTNGEG